MDRTGPSVNLSSIDGLSGPSHLTDRTGSLLVACRKRVLLLEKAPRRCHWPSVNHCNLYHWPRP